MVIQAWTSHTMMLSHRLDVMTQALYTEDKANLPNGIYMMKAYTELKPGSQNVSVVVRNMTSRPVHLAVGWVILRITTANEVPVATPSPELLKKLNQEDPTVMMPKLTVEQCHELLIDTLEKTGTWDQLKDLAPEQAAKARWLLLEFHQIFSLEPNEMGCTDAMEHMIEVMDDQPFKEWFQRLLLCW